jgi:pyruvate/2-oxoglutarate dehydrogenase complex dihydrolipoamide acyltransferase (E2) component
MSHTVLMPSGFSATRGAVHEWHKAVGDRVSRDDLIATVETDTVIWDVHAPVDGTLSARFVAIGVWYPVDTPIAQITDLDADRSPEGATGL